MIMVTAGYALMSELHNNSIYLLFESLLAQSKNEFKYVNRIKEE